MELAGLGAALRQARLQQGRDLEDISSQTRISLRFLEAIEDEDFGTLPAIVFTRNFVRQYATVLHVDPEPLLDGLPKVDPMTAPMPDPSQFPPRPPRRFRWISLIPPVLWILLACGISTAAYLHFFKPAPALIVVAREPDQGSPAAAPSQTPPLSAEKHAKREQAIPAESDGQTSGTPAIHPVEVVLKAKETSWVEIIADGRNAFTGILNANDSRAVEADSLVELTAGNAGGVEISLNGKSLEALGPAGEVRTVTLTAEGQPLVSKTPRPLPAPL